MKSKKWQFQETKNKFSEVVRKATEEGLQMITRDGKDSVVAISVEDYKKIKRPETSLVTFHQQSPLASAELDLGRDKSPDRDISL